MAHIILSLQREATHHVAMQNGAINSYICMCGIGTLYKYILSESVKLQEFCKVSLRMRESERSGRASAANTETPQYKHTALRTPLR